MLPKYYVRTPVCLKINIFHIFFIFTYIYIGFCRWWTLKINIFHLFSFLHIFLLGFRCWTSPSCSGTRTPGSPPPTTSSWRTTSSPPDISSPPSGTSWRCTRGGTGWPCRFVTRDNLIYDLQPGAGYSKAFKFNLSLISSRNCS